MAGKRVKRLSCHIVLRRDLDSKGYWNIGGSGTGTSVRDQLLNKVENPKLKNAINEIYRPGADVGDGGLTDEVVAFSVLESVKYLLNENQDIIDMVGNRTKKLLEEF